MESPASKQNKPNKNGPRQNKILWVDDEIESLKPHFLFLEERGYQLTGCVSGDDALALVEKQNFDLVLLDEMMPVKDGLTTLEELKELRPHLPVVMVTKSEEESLMEQAIGQKIDDYLTKPANPSQVLMVIKRILETRKIREESLSRRYIADINRFNQKLFGALAPEDWYEAARILSEWDLELDEHPDIGLAQTHEGTRIEWNNEFTKYIDRNYKGWLQKDSNKDERPVMSPDIIDHYLAEPLKRGEKTLFFVIDCMRLDQWLAIEPLLSEYYDIKREHYYSILPTATPYARNSMFAGVYPDEVFRMKPDIWSKGDAGSLNRHEESLFQEALASRGIRPQGGVRYAKVFNNTESDALSKRIADYYQSHAVAIVINFLDIMSHGRSNNMILKEIAADESSFRDLMKTWFTHSSAFKILKDFAAQGYTVIVTTDHGSKLCNRGALAHGRRDTSTTLRYKIGDNLNCDQKQGVLIKKPEEYRLPKPSLATTYLIAREDYYFVYPNKYNEFVRQCQNSFQHGGISIEEMIVPIAIMRPRR